MKKLRFADAISFRILLFVFFVVSMFSACNKTEMQDMEKNISKTQTVEKEALTSKEVSLDYTEINANLEEFARTLALQMANAEIRTLIKKEALKKFDGDYDILYKNFKDLTLTTGKTVESKLVEKNAEISTKAAKIPKFQISVPVNCEKWDTESFTPLVAVAPQGVQEKEMKKFKAFDHKGNVYWLDAKTTPDFPVVAVGMNERTDLYGKVYDGYIKDPKKSPSNGRTANSMEILGRIYMPDPSEYETWIQGALDLRLTISATITGQSITKPKDNVLYSVGCECAKDHNGNYNTLRGCYMGDFLFTWDLSYSDKIYYYWIEEDGGTPGDIPLMFTFPVGGVPVTLNTTIPKLSWDDDFGSNAVTRTELSGQRYGSSSVFEFQINF